METFNNARLMMTGVERVEHAVKIFEKAAKLAKQELKRSEQMAKPHEQSFCVGLAAYEVREYDAAIAFLSTAFQMAPLAPTAALLALSYWRIDDFSNAESWIKQAIAISPNGEHHAKLLGENISYLALYSAIHLAQGKIDAASSTVATALEHKAEPLSLRVRAHVLLAQGKGDEALKSLDEGIANMPKNVALTELHLERKLVSDLIGARVEVTPFFSVSRVGSWPD